MPTIKYPKNPNIDTAFVEQDDGTKNRALMIAPQDISTLELPNNPNSTKGYITVDGQKQRVILTADITGGGGGGSGLPDQTGHSGEFLTTDGTDASWSDKPLVNTSTNSQVSYAIGTSYPLSKPDTTLIGGARGDYTGCVAIGSGARASNNYAVSIGNSTESGNYSVSIGRGAKATAINAIQINAGTVYNSNTDANTFKVANTNGNYEMMSADGTIPTARFTTDPVSDGTYVPTLTITSGVATRSWSAPSGGLPSQTGQSGKFLTTDGTDASWSDKPLVNKASSNGSLVINGYEGSGTGVININSSWNRSTVYGVGAINIGGGSVGTDSYNRADYAIQLGGVNATSNKNIEPKTLCVGFSPSEQYKLLDSDGTIPEARLADTTNAQQGDVLTLDANGNAVWQAGGGGGLQNTATSPDSLTILGTATNNSESINIGLASAVHDDYSVVYGNNARTSYSQQSVVVGFNAAATDTVGTQQYFNTVCGYAAQTRDASNGVAIGNQAFVGANGAMQFGCGGNTEAGTVCFALTTSNDDSNFTNYKLLDSDGTIPADRLASTTGLADGNYRLRLTITSGVPTLSWVAE